MATVRDLALDANYDLSIVGQDLAPLLTDVDSIVSDVKSALLFHLGEWFLDQTLGVPWMQEILSVKNPNLTNIKNKLIQAIQNCQGITQVLVLTFVPDFKNRFLTITWQAQSNFGLLNNTFTVKV